MFGLKPKKSVASRAQALRLSPETNVPAWRRLRAHLALVGAVALALGQMSEPVLAADIAPKVSMSLGAVEGVWMEQGSVAAYLGVPFAQPPVGPLRFAKPVPSAGWGEQVLAASRFKPACMQAGKVPADSGMSEDCLYLNIYVPDASAQKARAPARATKPVMVYLHGGRYWTGRASENAVQKLAREADAVVVTVSYRLNAFGFMTDAERARRGESNLGLQDQQAALRWVRKHIGAFGGDAARVTLFGESAGAGSVLQHLTMPSSQGLFQRAILQSTWQWQLPTLAQTAAGTRAWAEGLGCPTQSSAAMTACLRGLPAEKLVPPLAQSHVFQPTVDGQWIQGQPLSQLHAARAHSNVPVMLGLNRDEGHFMAMSRTGWKRPDQAVDDATYLRAAREALQPFYSSTQVEDILSWYAPVRAKQGNWQALSALLGDFYLNCGSYGAAQALARSHRAPLQAYWFAHVSQNHTKPYLGASHGDELDLLFGLPVYPPGYALSADDQKLSRNMMRAWGEFAREGRVARFAGAAAWPQLSAHAPLAQVLAEPAPSAPHPFSDLQGQCQRWQSLML